MRAITLLMCLAAPPVPYDSSSGTGNDVVAAAIAARRAAREAELQRRLDYARRLRVSKRYRGPRVVGRTYHHPAAGQTYSLHQMAVQRFYGLPRSRSCHPRR